MGIMDSSLTNKYDVLALINSNRIFWCLIALALIILFGTIFICMPSLTSQISEDETGVINVRNRLLAVEAYQLEHNDYIAYEDDLAKELEYRHRLLPQEMTTATIMGELQQKAAGTGVELIGIKPAEDATVNSGQNKQKNSSVLISLSVKGTYFQCLDFIHSITASGQLIRIQTLEVNAEPKIAGIICKLDITAYGDSEDKGM